MKKKTETVSDNTYTEKDVIALLRSHRMKRAALTNLRTRMEALRYDSELLEKDEIAKQRKEMKTTAALFAADVTVVERSLLVLNEEEKRVVDLFFIEPPSKFQSWDVLCEELGYERSKIYRIRKAALKKLLTSIGCA